MAADCSDTRQRGEMLDGGSEETRRKIMVDGNRYI
jgi:hypothetical protein